MSWNSYPTKKPTEMGYYLVWVDHPKKKGLYLYLVKWETTFTTKIQRWGFRNVGGYANINKWSDRVKCWMAIPPVSKEEKE